MLRNLGVLKTVDRNQFVFNNPKTFKRVKRLLKFFQINKN